MSNTRRKTPAKSKKTLAKKTVSKKPVAKSKKPVAKKTVAKKPTSKANKTVTKKPTAKSKKTTKIDRLIEMLSHENGASPAQIERRLGWVNHSVRGRISGTLRKERGLNVVRIQRKSGLMVYKIVA